MARYGIKFCWSCYGYGIALNRAELLLVRMAIRQQDESFLPNVQREGHEVERCSECKGTGWILAANYPKITLPSNTWKRW
jgi:DnaJ-class molecular chaperone